MSRSKSYPTFRLFLLGTVLSMAAPAAWAQSAGGQGSADPFTGAGLDNGQNAPPSTEDKRSAKDRAAEDLKKQQEKNDRVNNMMQNLRDGKYTRGAGAGGGGTASGSGTSKGSDPSADQRGKMDERDADDDFDPNDVAGTGTFVRKGSIVQNGFAIDGFTDAPICVPDHTPEGEQSKLAALKRDLVDLAYTKAHDAEWAVNQQEELEEIYGHEAERHAECAREEREYARQKGRAYKSRIAQSAPDLAGMIKRGKTDNSTVEDKRADASKGAGQGKKGSGGGEDGQMVFGPDIDLTNPVIAEYVKLYDAYIAKYNDGFYNDNAMAIDEATGLENDIEDFIKNNSDKVSKEEFRRIANELIKESERTNPENFRVKDALAKGPLTPGETEALGNYRMDKVRLEDKLAEAERMEKRDPSPENRELRERAERDLRQLEDNPYRKELEGRQSAYADKSAKSDPNIKPFEDRTPEQLEAARKRAESKPSVARKPPVKSTQEHHDDDLLTPLVPAPQKPAPKTAVTKPVAEQPPAPAPQKPAPKARTTAPASGDDELLTPLVPVKPPEVKNPSPVKRGSDG